jgi:hypothetical protein
MNKLDKYLEEIQLQEGVILIGMGILAAALAVAYIDDKIDRKKAERALHANKKIIDKIVAEHLNKILNTTWKYGASLHKELTGKYKDVTKYWNRDEGINKLKDKQEYVVAIKKAVADILRAFINSKQNATLTNKHNISFFESYFGLYIGDDDASENVWYSKEDVLHTKEYPDEEKNPYYKKWVKNYIECKNLIRKADKTVHPLFVKVTSEILSTIRNTLVKTEGMIQEAGFKKMPKGWDKKSVKKFANTIAQNEAVQNAAMKKGFFDKCVKKMGKHMEDPEGFCASVKDQASGSTYWRGKGKSPQEAGKDVKQHQNVKEGIDVIDDFLNMLYTDNRPQAKEWRGANIPYGDDSNRPNLIRKCMTLESNRQKINCLRKLRDQVAMNPFYQARLDRFVDAITDIYEPTKEQGTIPGNEFKPTAVGEDLTEGIIQKTQGHLKHGPDLVKTIDMVKYLAMDMGYKKEFDLKFCRDVPQGKERKQCLLKNKVISLQGQIKALEDFASGKGNAGKRFSGGCRSMQPDRKIVCERLVRRGIKELQKELKPLLRKYRSID